jgi:alpha-pyrone synthase
MVEPKIIAIGTAVPDYKITGKQHFNFVKERSQLSAESERLFSKIYSGSEIEQRYSVINDFLPELGESSIFPHISTGNNLPDVGQRMLLYEKFAPELAFKAVENCIKNCGLENLNRITHLITFSCTGMYAPGLDVELIKRFNLNSETERYCINFMGCYAAIVAIRNAYHIVKSNPGAMVLLAGVELCTLHYAHTNDTEQAVANAIFGDGAAAVIISGRNDQNAQFKLKRFKTQTIPTADQEMTWKIRNDYFRLKLSAYVPVMIRQGVSELVKGLSAGTVNSQNNKIYAIHPGGAAILKACEKALSLTLSDLSNSYTILRKYGNMSSVTILFVLEELIKNHRQNQDKKEVIACAFGPGLTMESMLLEII